MMCLKKIFLITALCFFFANHLPDERCKDSTSEWTYDEYPEVRKCLSAFEESWTDRACRVHRCASVVNTYKVDENE